MIMLSVGLQYVYFVSTACLCCQYNIMLSAEYMYVNIGCTVHVWLCCNDSMFKLSVQYGYVVNTYIKFMLSLRYV